MKTRRGVAVVIALVAAAVAASTAGAVGRSVSVGNFQVSWSATDPEEITSLSWEGSTNLTNTWGNGTQCQGSDLEFFGNAWAPGEAGVHPVLVGGGSTGLWTSLFGNVLIGSIANCPPQTGFVPVVTHYRFFSQGPQANTIRVDRTFAFGHTAFTDNLRPYIPRLYPEWAYTDVIFPNAAGTGLNTAKDSNCENGCQLSDWNGSWLAIRDPNNGRGLIVHRLSSSPADVWVDEDGGSNTNASSILLLAPPGGFTGLVTDSEALCFYDSSIWTPSLTLPPGC